jgi:hypothetical protein
MRPSQSWIPWARNPTRTALWSCSFCVITWPCGPQISRYLLRPSIFPLTSYFFFWGHSIYSTSVCLALGGCRRRNQGGSQGRVWRWAVKMIHIPRNYISVFGLLVNLSCALGSGFVHIGCIAACDSWKLQTPICAVLERLAITSLLGRWCQAILGWGSLYLFESLVLLCICRLSLPVACLHVHLFSIVDFDVFPSMCMHDALELE